MAEQICTINFIFKAYDLYDTILISRHCIKLVNTANTLKLPNCKQRHRTKLQKLVCFLCPCCMSACHSNDPIWLGLCSEVTQQLLKVKMLVTPLLQLPRSALASCCLLTRSLGLCPRHSMWDLWTKWHQDRLFISNFPVKIILPLLHIHPCII